jgi:pilus assembly protein CpaB
VRRRLLAAVAALVLLVAGAAVLLAYVNGAERRALAGVQTVDVLVADEPIPAGTPAAELAALVRTEVLPRKAALAGRISDLSELAGRVAAVDLEAGEQLLASRFQRPGDLQAAGTVPVPDGLQEISVLLDPQRVIGARLAAGSTVGVYLSQVLPDGTGQTSAVLHHVLVTQVQGAPTPPDPDAEAGVDPASAAAPATSLMVTLAVTAQDAETVVFGMEHGTLWLSLETDGDETGGTRVVDPSTIYGGVGR